MIRETLVIALAFAQTAAGTFSTSASVPVSASVIATDMCTVDAEGKGTLELLVLWRGSPGWFRSDKGGSSGAGGWGGRGRAGGGDRVETRTAWLTEGGVNLSVRIEPSSRKAWIQDREIDLNDANVVLVDDVDTGAGLRIAGLAKIDPSYYAGMEIDPDAMRAGSPRTGRVSRQPRPVQMFIRRSPELIDYLRCDVPLPDAPQEEARIFEMYCSALIQR